MRFNRKRMIMGALAPFMAVVMGGCASIPNQDPPEEKHVCQSACDQTLLHAPVEHVTQEIHVLTKDHDERILSVSFSGGIHGHAGSFHGACESVGGLPNSDFRTIYNKHGREVLDSAVKEVVSTKDSLEVADRPDFVAMEIQVIVQHGLLEFPMEIYDIEFEWLPRQGD